MTKHGCHDVSGPKEFWRKTTLAHNANQLACKTHWEDYFSGAGVVTISISCYMLQIWALGEIIRQGNYRWNPAMRELCKEMETQHWAGVVTQTAIPRFIWEAEARSRVWSWPERHRETFQMQQILPSLGTTLSGWLWGLWFPVITCSTGKNGRSPPDVMQCLHVWMRSEFREQNTESNTQKS